MAKFHKVGQVQTKKDKSGVTVKLGDPENKNPKFVRNVRIQILDGSGKVVAQAENGYLMVQDPRKNPNLTEEQAGKIPDWVKSELVLVTDGE